MSPITADGEVRGGRECTPGQTSSSYGYIFLLSPLSHLSLPCVGLCQHLPQGSHRGPFSSSLVQMWEGV